MTDDKLKSYVDQSFGMKTYIIRAGNDGPVKIGRARHVASRVASLQTAHYEELRIIRVIEGEVESLLHGRFAVHRIRGEWFHFDPAMLTFLPESTDDDVLYEQYRRALDMPAAPAPKTIYLAGALLPRAAPSDDISRSRSLECGTSDSTEPVEPKGNSGCPGGRGTTDEAAETAHCWADGGETLCPNSCALEGRCAWDSSNPSLAASDEACERARLVAVGPQGRVAEPIIEDSLDYPPFLRRALR